MFILLIYYVEMNTKDTEKFVGAEWQNGLVLFKRFTVETGQSHRKTNATTTTTEYSNLANKLLYSFKTIKKQESSATLLTSVKGVKLNLCWNEIARIFPKLSVKKCFSLVVVDVVVIILSVVVFSTFKKCVYLHT